MKIDKLVYKKHIYIYIYRIYTEYILNLVHKK